MKHKSNKRTKEITPAFLKYVGGGGKKSEQSNSNGYSRAVLNRRCDRVVK